jgi:hypothetical protein
MRIRTTLLLLFISTIFFEINAQNQGISFEAITSKKTLGSNSWINGKRSFSKVYTYFLSPLKKGSLSIGQASIEIKEKLYKTMPVKVIVSESVTINNDPNNSNYLVNENLHLVAEVSNTNPFLNEGISVVYKLFFSPQINVTNVGEIDSPEYVDFWSNNIKIPRLQIERGSYKGDSYNYVIWKKMVLYPQKEGELNIKQSHCLKMLHLILAEQLEILKLN